MRWAGAQASALSIFKIMELSSIDNFGQRIDQNYSLILTDASFEKRLKIFDPNLKLMFDQSRKRWTVMEWARDHSGWNVILVAEDKEGNPEPLGEWVFKALRIKRDAWEKKMAMGANTWFNHMMDKARDQKNKLAAEASRENVDMIKDDIIQWRKAAKEFEKGVPSDVTAGYAKRKLT